ncbi:hypothetical protein ABE504_23450 [Paenibacillus oryzisoli]
MAQACGADGAANMRGPRDELGGLFRKLMRKRIAGLLPRLMRRSLHSHR